jgi:hypothetical protein
MSRYGESIRQARAAGFSSAASIGEGARRATAAARRPGYRLNAGRCPAGFEQLNELAPR